MKLELGEWAEDGLAQFAHFGISLPLAEMEFSGGDCPNFEIRHTIFIWELKNFGHYM